MAPREAFALIGGAIGPYQIQALLGSGGMATVYQGFDPQLQRPVAIKLLSPALAGDPDYVRRFEREAQLVASLRHPNVAQVYTLGEHNGTPYMVQELLPGPTLDQRLNDLAVLGRRMARAEVLGVVRQLGAALDAAHAVGVIHRDLKPANAITNAHGELVLTDFGIARSAADTTSTMPGVVLGTPAYLSPEQASGSPVLTPAVDVYALGVLLFQLLTGRLPFQADTAMAMALKHLAEAPPAPSQLRPDLPPELDAVVLRALAKEPAARFQRAGALAEAVALAWPEPGAAPAGMHGVPTTPWAPPATPAVAEVPASAWQPAAQATGPYPAPVAALPAPSPTYAAPLPAPTPPALDRSPRAGRGRSCLLPLLAAALALLMLTVCGGLAFQRLLAALPGVGALPGASSALTPEPAVLATVPPEVTAEPVLLPTAPPEPTAEPVVLPTAAPAPAPTAEPAPPPTAEPAPAPSNPLDELGQLLAAGLSDGSGGPQAAALFDHYEGVIKGLNEGDPKAANDELRELEKKVREDLRKGELDPAFGERVLALADSVRAAYGLPGGGGGNDDGDD